MARTRSVIEVTQKRHIQGATAETEEHTKNTDTDTIFETLFIGVHCFTMSQDFFEL